MPRLSFDEALNNHPNDILDALDNPNSFARCQTLALLISRRASSPAFIDKARSMTDDLGAAPFGKTVGDVAKMYLEAVPTWAECG